MGMWKKIAAQGKLYGGMREDADRKEKLKASRKKRKAKKRRQEFYTSREWKELRYRALKLSGAKCQCCGASRKDGVSIHVDHIKPRSKHPELQLTLSNLQVLCEPCNIGKSNKDATDWR